MPFGLDLQADEITLVQLYDILKKKHDKATILKLMRAYCLQTSSKDIQKKGMEFLYMHGFFDDLTKLIRKNQQSSDKTIRQWAEIYSVYFDLKKNKQSPKELLQRINTITASEPELYFLAEITKMKLYAELHYYHPIGNFINIADRLLASIYNPLLLDSFRVRYNQITFFYHLTRNELIIARKTAYNILNSTENPDILVQTHIKLGLSYTFESLYQGMYHLRRAREIAKEYEMRAEMKAIEEHYIPFLSAHFNKPENIDSTDKGEQAHLEIAKGNHKKAIDILESSSLDTPFHLYYLGKAKKDRALLINSYRQFIHNHSDYFFSRLPLNELRKLD